MSKKRLQVEAITNELKGASLFFAKPLPSSQQPHPMNSEQTPGGQPKTTTLYVSEPKRVRLNERTSERPNVRKETRRVIRHAFDIFADQLYALQTIQLEAVRNNKKKPKLGGMVQQALDLYLEQIKEKKIKP